MAERYSALCGMDIDYTEEKFNTKIILDKYSNIRNLIVFDCTDNIKARRSIEETLTLNRSYLNIVLISCGNEDDFGQVMVTLRKDQYSSGRVNDLLEEYVNLRSKINQENPKNKIKINNSPSLLELFRDFKDTEKPSCTDMTLIDDQSMPINSLVAQIAYNIFYNIVAGQELNYFMVKCNINNTFSTNYLSYPLDALNLIVKGIYGECSEKAIEAIDSFYVLSHGFPNTDQVVEYFNTRDRKYTEIFYDKLTSGYAFRKENAFERLNWRK